MKISKDSQTTLKAIQDAKRLGLLVSAEASVDTGAASMALFHLFSAAGKKVVPIVPGRIPDGVRGLPSSIEIKPGFGPKNLVVTLDTNQTPIEKVSYKAEDRKFRLTIHPLGRNFEIENVHYAYEGLNFDLLVTLGVAKLSDLGELYEKNRYDFAKTTIINLDVRRENENYGQINIVDPSKSSVCELIFHQLLVWKLVPSKEVAQCLLTGLAAVASTSSESLPIKSVEVPAELSRANFQGLAPSLPN